MTRAFWPIVLLSFAVIGVAVALGIIIGRSIGPFHHPCNHGESSISGHFEKNASGKTVFITDQPVTRTGC